MRQWWNSWVGLDRFGPLLVLLVAAFVLSGTGETWWPRAIGSLLNLAALMAGMAATDLSSSRRRMIVLIAVGVLGGTLVGVFDQASVWVGVGAMCQAIVLTGILLAVLRRVLSHDQVELSTITGAIVAYVLIGLVFAWVYLAAYGFLTEPILEPEATGVPSYYSFVVLTTLGFGDISPAHQVVQRVTALEAVIGQIFLATLVARLVAMYGAPRYRSASDIREGS